MSTAVPIKVSLDVSAIPARPAGAGHYVVQLSRALAARADVEVVRVSRRDDAARWQPDGAVVAAAPGNRVARLAWEQFGMAGVLRREGVALHHGPHYTMPERAPVPVVVTVHDCTYFDHPEWHERSKVLVFRRAIRHAARAAAAIVCVSEVTRQELEAHCTVRAPVVVAPHGVDTQRFSPHERSPGSDERDLAGLGIEGRPYVAFVGTIEPRKNVAGLVRAFDSIGDVDARLVLAGGEGWHDREVGAALGGLRHPERVVRTGYLPDALVPPLLRRAAAVAYPSFAEGYGLPALEALACGTTLITTAGTSMASFAAGAAVEVPAGDDPALAEALRVALRGEESAGVVEARIARGLAVASSSTWAASADRHVAAYRLAAGI
jgi:glycosyltransferase involved in cell wall biosynthesis